MIGDPIAHQAVTEYGCSQDKTELSILLAVVSAQHPDLIVEIGCNTGGSLYAWRSICKDVIGISLGPHDPRDRAETHGAAVITGDSHHDGTIELLKKKLAGRRPDFFFIDGDHSELGCRMDWVLAQDVGARCVGFHDISPRRVPGDPGVRKVFAEACAKYPSVVIRNPADPMNPGAGIVWLT